MTEEYIIEEEETNRRPFLLAVAALTTIFILASICGLAFLLSGRSARDRAEEIAAIETQNAIIAITNEAVTMTIAAMETEAAVPTDTPEPTPTNTSTPEPDTPTPTDTPVIDAGEIEATPPETEATLPGTPDDTVTTPLPGTVIGTPGVDGTATPIAPVTGTIDGGTALPETGLNTWGAIAIALVLIATLFLMRRLRSG